jgi:hypothetical protein
LETLILVLLKAMSFLDDGVCCFGGCFNSIEVQKDGSGNMTLEWK